MQISAEQLANLHRLAPEIILCAAGILVMVLDPFVGPARQRALGYLSLAGALGALCAVRLVAIDQGLAYSGLIRADEFSIFVDVVVIGAAAIAILGSFSYLDQEGLQRGEYYVLVLFATAGMGILAGANELVTAFIGLEMSSISTHILAGFRRRALESNEASLKYFLLGSFATAFFLYGIAMAYGATGTTRIDAIQAAFQITPPASLAILGLGLMFVGLGFKVVAAPFQIYAPDVYQGAPTPVTALLASAPKVATFAVMVRIFYVAFGASSDLWFWAVWVSAVLTMCIGNFAALVQTNVKRMVAYSSIAHAGYILVAFAAATDLGVAAILFYLAAYALMKIGAFLVLSHLGQQGEKRLAIQDSAGLGSKQPMLAACFSPFLRSLLGLPATGGCLVKVGTIRDELDEIVLGLLSIAAINSVIGAYYYLRVIVAMYFWEPSKDYVPTRVAPSLATALAVCAVGTLYLGILPGRVLSFARAAAGSLVVR